MEPPVYGTRDHITFERDGPLAWIVIDNLAEQNRLSLAGVARLRHIANALRAEPSLHVVVIRGVGTEYFCTGVLNPALRAGMSKDEVLKLVFLAGETFDALEALPQVVVAGLNGTSRAGGAELALACDIRFAAEHARMSMPEAQWGGFPGAGGPVRLPGLVGRGRALELISTGREIAADEMLRIGLLERVVASAEFDTAVAEFAATIAKSGPLGSHWPVSRRAVGTVRFLRQVRACPRRHHARPLCSEALSHDRLTPRGSLEDRNCGTQARTIAPLSPNFRFEFSALLPQSLLNSGDAHRQ